MDNDNMLDDIDLESIDVELFQELVRMMGECCFIKSCPHLGLGHITNVHNHYPANCEKPKRSFHYAVTFTVDWPDKNNNWNHINDCSKSDLIFEDSEEFKLLYELYVE